MAIRGGLLLSEWLYDIGRVKDFQLQNKFFIMLTAYVYIYAF